MITAPFNFVPLSDKVFFPPWAEDVSHDVPFEDAESGVIDITITAKSPIFIRDSEKEEEFCQHNKEYYIPSSSIKGMVRNVLEIMSFSKMSFFNDDTYAVRDFSDSRNFYMTEMKKDTFCGWLKKDGNNYIIEDCEKPGRIKHEEIDKIFGIDFASKFKEGTFGDKAQDKTALKKYEMIKSKNFTYPLKHTSTSTVGDNRYSHDTSSTKMGTIVFTGQPSARKEPTNRPPSGKVYEFVFFDPIKEIKLTQKVIDNFLFAYFDGRTTEPKESPDWSFWKSKLYSGEKIPIFFQKDGNTIKHFGLSYLYKLPYNHSISKGIEEAHFDKRIDLAQSIFGYVNGNDALKGRVEFSHFKAIENIEPLASRTEILGTPRASYYPIYIRQSDNDKLKTYMDNDFEIAGWKRYPIHKGSGVKQTQDTGNTNVGTTFAPLKEGVVFHGKLRYHNLKKAELGALLSALTFHTTPNTYHNIGMAKPLGYGKIKIALSSIENVNSYLKAFELTLGEQIPNWSESSQIKELLTMASEQDNLASSTLEYMVLDDFSKYKTREHRDYLRCYSELDNIQTITVQTQLDENEQKSLLQKYEAFQEQERAYQEAKKIQQKYQEDLYQAQTTDNLDIIKNFITKYPDTEEAQLLQSKVDTIEKEQQASKHQEVDKKAKSAWELVQKKKGNPKQYQKELDKFIKKWGADKNNKGSQFILELVAQAKKERK